MKTFKNPLSLLLTLILIAVFLISSCNKKVDESTAMETVAEPTFNLESAKAEIEAANKEFMAFFTAVDSVGLSNLYTEDSKLMMNGNPAITGRENVVSTFSSIMKSGISRANLKTIEVWGNDEIITEEGEYALYVGDDQADHGKYIVLWKNEDGKWKLHRDIFNTDVTAE